MKHARQPTFTRALVRTQFPHFRGFLFLNLRQCALRLRVGTIFLFNSERSEHVGRKYCVYSDDEGSGWKNIMSAHKPDKIEKQNI